MNFMHKSFFTICFFTLMLAALLTSAAEPVYAQTPEPTLSEDDNPIPMLAYYYIWFDSNSWDRAKIDYPLLGRYTSDDRAVMRKHIQWAKAAGIDGFIVSWKSTDILDRRLYQLAEVAEEENFKLVVIYQGLDFERNPLPIEKIASDLAYFKEAFAHRNPFQLFSKPAVIWSGTWEFSEQDIATVTETHRDALLILATEKNIKGYQRVASLVDGNAYYWSSVNPETFPGYLEKLKGMSDEVHKNGGLWIAPAAPGFNAKAIGGTSVVERKDGATFRTELNTAMASSPDAVGIISWNEFSENSHIEPSETYGSKYLDLLSGMTHVSTPAIGDFDSSEPAKEYPETISYSRYIALGGLAVLIVMGLIVIARRHNSSPKP